MYERVVTAFHIHQNPDDADLFLDYHWIQRRKLAHAIANSIEKAIDLESVSRLEAHYKAVKDKYQVVLCRECGAKGTNFRWHKLDVVAMANKTDVDAIRNLLVRAYYVPLEHAHSTAGSLLFQIADHKGVPVLKEQQDPLYADEAVAVAHLLVILAIAALRQRLQLDSLQPLIDLCAKEHALAWD
jgi:hypothetical protein